MEVVTLHVARAYDAGDTSLSMTNMKTQATNFILIFLDLGIHARSSTAAVVAGLMDRGDDNHMEQLFAATVPGGPPIQLGDLGGGRGKVFIQSVTEIPDMSAAAGCAGQKKASAKKGLLHTTVPRGLYASMETQRWNFMFFAPVNRSLVLENLAKTTGVKEALGLTSERRNAYNPRYRIQDLFHKFLAGAIKTCTMTHFGALALELNALAKYQECLNECRPRICVRLSEKCSEDGRKWLKAKNCKIGNYQDVRRRIRVLLSQVRRGRLKRVVVVCCSSSCSPGSAARCSWSAATRTGAASR